MNNAAPLVYKPTVVKKPEALSRNQIVLATLNAKYIHASLGLRYLYANLNSLQRAACIQEFTINQRPVDIAEQLLLLNPKIIGLGVYIWNIEQTTEVVGLIKSLRPDINLVIGGPEVSYEYELTKIFSQSDFLITGQADFAFMELCQLLLQNAPPSTKVINATPPPVTQLTAPYNFYNIDDIANRILYVEASRGCPFKCEFCLSALDKTAQPFDQQNFIEDLGKLYERGARQFKFVDRTFNLKTKNCIEILEFFLARLDDKLFVHFEVIPDKLPTELKTVIQQFPAGTLQFEVGIQSFDVNVQQTINRKQNMQRTLANMQWLRQNTNAYIHADLIVGLPGETLDSFAAGFDQLVALNPHEIQVGILKRLRGTTIARHTDKHDMRYADTAPYQLLQNSNLNFTTMQRLQRFARYWDLLANSSRFTHSMPLILGNDPFSRFWDLSDWIYTETGQTHKISLSRLFKLLHRGVHTLGLCDEQLFLTAIEQDYSLTGEKGRPPWHAPPDRSRNNAAQHASRQARHTNTVTKQS